MLQTSPLRWIVILLVLSQLRVLSQAVHNNYEAGIQNFYPPQISTSQDSPVINKFTILYRQAYQSRPVTLIAPLGFQIKLDKNQNGHSSTFIKLNVYKQEQDKVEVILQSSFSIFILKASYLFMPKDIWEWEKLYLPIEVQSANQQNGLTQQDQKLIKIRQIVCSNDSRQSRVHKEYFTPVPFGSNDFQAHIFTKELRLFKGKLYLFHLSAKKISQTIQVSFQHNQVVDPFSNFFPNYQLILREQNVDQNQLSLKSIQMTPSDSYQTLVTKRGFFIAFSSFQFKESPSQINFNIRKNAQQYHLLGKKAAITLLIFQLNQEDLRWQKKGQRLLLTCASPTYVTTYENHWLTWVDPTNKNIQTCQACPTGCYGCTYCSNCWRYVNCTLCRTGFNFVKFTHKNDNQYVCTCPSGTYPNATTNTCMGCTSVIPNCASCKAGSSGHYSATCATCAAGFFAVANSGSWGGYTECAGCTAGCSSCVTNTSCNSCGAGLTKSSSGVCSCPAGLYYSLITKTCTTCALAITNCTSCVAVSTTTTCTACAIGSYASANGTSCVSCSSNCNNCTSSSCVSCAPTFIIQNSTCVCDANASKFLNTTSNTCVACTAFYPGCSLCVNNGTVSCSSCIDGTFLSNNSCVGCLAECTSCSALSVCTACVSNLVVINDTCTCDSTNSSYLNTLTTTCFQCSEIISQCSICGYNSTSSSVYCSTCSTGYYLINDTCLSCLPTCLNCTNNLTCGDCISGYQLNNVTFECDCIDCVTCDSLNLTNCSSCINNGTAVCTQCIVGSYLDNSSSCQICPVGCSTCSSSTICLTCTSPFIPSSPVGECVCNSLLLLYYNPSTLTCDSCSSIITNCTQCTTSSYVTTCLACQSNQFIDNNTCLSCPYPCTTCNSSTICTACTDTFVLINDTCTCDNSSQIFFNNLTNICSPCATLTTSLCLLCSVDPLATNSSEIKCSSCQVGYFPDPITYLCSSCPSTCVTCSDLVTCGECVNTFVLISNECVCDASTGFYLYGSICLPCFSIINYCQGCSNSTGGITCTTCGEGTYLSASNDTCVLCPVNCNVCNSTGCTQCFLGYNLDANGICVCSTTCINFTTADSSCVNCNLLVNATDNTSTLQCLSCKSKTFVVSNQSCNACPDSCATCSDYVTCLTCAVGFTLVSNNCVCNDYFNEVLVGSACQSCGSLISGCQTCTYASGNAVCTACIEGWGIQNGSCVLCGTGCSQCTVAAGVPTCSACYNNFTLAGSCSNNTDCSNNLGQYFNINNVSCTNCMDNCQQCYKIDKCVTCKPTFSYLKGKCVCNNGKNQYLDLTLGNCTVCQSTLDNSSTLYLANCLVCQSSSANYANGIQCLDCADGYYLSAGTCLACLSGCQKCTGNTSCCSCDTPAWIMNNGVCICDNALNYFDDGNSSCQVCVIANCSACSNLTTCLMCNLDSFVNSSGLCQLAICGNSFTQGIQTCDDGNTNDGDGCSSSCQIEQYYFCNNSPPPSFCYLDNRFNVQIKQILASCNKITLNFKMYPFYDYLNSGNYSSFLYGFDLNSSTFVSCTQSKDIVSYEFIFAQTLQGYNATFVFDPSSLGINQTSTYPLNQVSFSVVPTNNILALYYQSSTCDSMEAFQKATEAIQYISYGTLALSALPCKIVGLQLFGVIQLAFMSLGSMDNVNILMTPMMDMKGVNGYSMDLGKDTKQQRLLQTSQTVTPQRLSSIGYNANFLRNCNFMLILVTSIILVSFVLFILTYLCKSCSLTLHSISKRLIKEVLLTMILFNCLNFAYSVGLHFRYATKEDSLYLLGTLAAIATLVIPIIMAIALSMAQEEGFGEFKDKLKKGCAEKAYFVITIAYRMSLGLYMSTSNEDELSTLLVLAFSILFLMYNLVNLPYTKAYHNYRANICHFTQFICLFVTMYYRSMKSSSSGESVASIHSPVYLQYTCIFISLVVSLIVLAYEIYLWIKECRESSNKGKIVSSVHESQGEVQVEDKKADCYSKTPEEKMPQIFSNAYDEYD